MKPYYSHAGIRFKGYEVTWKQAASGGTDWKALAAELKPSLSQIAAHARPGSRRFLVKTAGAAGRKGR